MKDLWHHIREEQNQQKEHKSLLELEQQTAHSMSSTPTWGGVNLKVSRATFIPLPPIPLSQAPKLETREEPKKEKQIKAKEQIKGSVEETVKKCHLLDQNCAVRDGNDKIIELVSALYMYNLTSITEKTMVKIGK